MNLSKSWSSERDSHQRWLCLIEAFLDVPFDKSAWAHVLSHSHINPILWGYRYPMCCPPDLLCEVTYSQDLKCKDEKCNNVISWWLFFWIPYCSRSRICLAHPFSIDQSLWVCIRLYLHSLASHIWAYIWTGTVSPTLVRWNHSHCIRVGVMLPSTWKMRRNLASAIAHVRDRDFRASVFTTHLTVIHATHSNATTPRSSSCWWYCFPYSDSLFRKTLHVQVNDTTSPAGENNSANTELVYFLFR
jgi:hypothetical protein